MLHHVQHLLSQVGCTSKAGYLDIVSMTRTVCVSIMSVGCGVFYMRGVDGDSSGLLLGGIVNVFILFIVSTTSISENWGPNDTPRSHFWFLLSQNEKNEVMIYLLFVSGAKSVSQSNYIIQCVWFLVLWATVRAKARTSVILPFVMAAVRVVLPWSTCPIVPMFTWGLSLLYVFLASAAKVRRLRGTAHYKTKTRFCNCKVAKSMLNSL